MRSNQTSIFAAQQTWTRNGNAATWQAHAREAARQSFATGRYDIATTYRGRAAQKR